ncbi:replication initiation protein [Fulvitalea axinellae]
MKYLISELGEYRVTKSNKLINRKEPFSLIQQRAVALAISQIQIDDDDFKPYYVSVRNVLGLDEGAHIGGKEYIKTRESVMQLTKTSIDYIRDPSDPNSAFDSISFIDRVNREEGSGEVAIHFHPAVKELLLKQRANFTSYALKWVFHFSSAFSLVIYELCKQYERIGERKISVELLRKHVVVPESKQRSFAQFRRRVIAPALKDINSLSDIRVQVEEKKTGRKISLLIFHIKSAPKSITQPKPTPKPEPKPVKQPETPVETAELPSWDIDLPKTEISEEGRLEEAREAFGKYYEKSRREWLRKVTREDKIAFQAHVQSEHASSEDKKVFERLRGQKADLGDWKYFARFVILLRGSEQEKRWTNMDNFVVDYLAGKAEQEAPKSDEMVW